MSQELLARVPSQQTILLANQAREKRRFSQVKELIGPIEGLTQAELLLVPTLDQTSQSSLLQAARIDVVANTSYATRPYFAPEAYRRLSHAFEIRHQFYDNEAVVHVARRTHQDSAGSAYEFYVEMQRDSARLLFSAFTLTQNPLFLTQGIGVLEGAIVQIRNSPPLLDETIEPLLRFELVRWQRAQWGSQESTIQLQHGFYIVAFRAAMNQGNFERAATIAAWQLIDEKAAHNLTLAEETMNDFLQQIPREYQYILEDQFHKEEKASLHQLTWRATRRFVSVHDQNHLLEQAGVIENAQ